MLYGNESISTYTKGNVLIWMAMGLQAGLINIGGFLACHRFVSHVTGFATFFGIETAQFEFGRAAGMLLVPILFLCGAMISGLLVDIRLQLHQRPKYYLAFGLMFILLMFVVVGGFNGVFGTFGTPVAEAREYALLALLCLACGIQNGTITSVSRAVVRTTHLTGITTDLGIGIVRVLHRHKLGDVSEDIKANFMRLGIIFCFGVGSVLGAFIYSRAGFRGFFFPAAISGLLFGATFYFQALKKPSKNQKLYTSS